MLLVYLGVSFLFIFACYSMVYFLFYCFKLIIFLNLVFSFYLVFWRDVHGYYYYYYRNCCDKVAGCGYLLMKGVKIPTAF